MSSLKDFNALMRMDYTQGYLRDVLGEKAQSFVANLTALVSNDKKLQECEPVTIMHAAITATAMGLPFDKNQGMAYVIPYKDRKSGMTVGQFQMGFKGFQQLAIRTNMYSDINATDVREGELKKIDRLTGRIKFEWNETADRDKLPIVGYVAYFKLLNGFSKTLYMTVEDIEKHAMRYSETYKSRTEWVHNNSKWVTDRHKMSLKTVIKQLLNDGTAPKSIEIQKAIAADQSVQYSPNEYTYVDNDKETAKDALAERAKERALAEDAEYSDAVAERPEATATEPAQPIDPNVNDLPFKD